MGVWTVPGYTDTRVLAQHPAGRTVVATHSATGTPVTIRYRDTPPPQLLTRWRTTAQRLTQLAAPQVAVLFEYVESDLGIAIVREYVPGPTLAELIAAPGTLAAEAALTVLDTALHGLARARDAGLIHGRLQPTNLFLTHGGEVKVADFDPEQQAPDDADIRGVRTLLVASLSGRAAPAEKRVPKRLRPLLSGPATVESLRGDLASIADREYGPRWRQRGQTGLARAHRSWQTHP